jgi:ATP-binding cassette subfamily B protein
VKLHSIHLQDLYPTLFIAVGSVFLIDIVEILNNTSLRILDYSDKLHLRKMLYDHLASLDLATLEKPEIANQSHRFTEVLNTIMIHLNMLVQFIGIVIALVSSGIILLAVSPVIVPLYLALMLPRVIANFQFILNISHFQMENTEYRRKSLATAGMLSEPASLKEIQITGGYSFLNRQFEKYLKDMVSEVLRIRKIWTMTVLGFDLAEIIGYGFALYFICLKFLSKSISIGQVVFYLRTVRMFEGSFSSLGVLYSNLKESSVRLADAQALFFDYTRPADGKERLTETTKPQDIKFIDVSFKYPQVQSYFINHVDLHIKPGEKVAIVGENGAGKTTLVKLLCRFYPVTAGKILIDDTDINEVRLKDWYDKLGVLFQDFNKYGQLTVKENIIIGRHTEKIEMGKIREAARNADTLKLIEMLPKGFDQILDERFEGGLRPSTGQWQKIAIARFFYRDAPVLILDEPTAAIDAVAEAKIFDSIYDFIQDKTVIIISHRFSTVRKADRIIVLDNGKIAEEGTHEELLKKNGKYAHAFNLQAEGYK